MYIVLINSNNLYPINEAVPRVKLPKVLTTIEEPGVVVLGFIKDVRRRLRSDNLSDWPAEGGVNTEGKVCLNAHCSFAVDNKLLKDLFELRCVRAVGLLAVDAGADDNDGPEVRVVGLDALNDIKKLEIVFSSEAGIDSEKRIVESTWKDRVIDDDGLTASANNLLDLEPLRV